MDGFAIHAAAAQHLAHKYGTLAAEVLELANADRSLMMPLVEYEAPIRAQVVYAVRKEMAMSIEDVLARRIGLQLYDWRLAIQAAPLVAALLSQELGWSPAEEQAAIEAYVAKVNHMITSAGQLPEPTPHAVHELSIGKS